MRRNPDCYRDLIEILLLATKRSKFKYTDRNILKERLTIQPLEGGYKKWQADYIAPLNHLLLLPSGPGRVQQELVV
jgi:hypothetical protein